MTLTVRGPAIIHAPGSREEWLMARRNYLTASDVASVLRVPGAFGTPWSVFESKVGPADDLDEETRDYIYFGRDVEGAIATGYERKYGRRVTDPGAWTLRVHPDIPWLAASLDRETEGSEEWPAPEGIAEREPGVLELKAPGMMKRKVWSEEGAPLPYVVQAQIQMAVTGRQWGSLVAMFGGLILGEPFDVLRNERFFKSAYPQLEAFWLRVQRRDPPEADGEFATSVAIRSLWPDDDGTTVELGPRELMLANRLERARLVGARVETRIEALQNELRAAMGAATFGNLPDKSHLSLKTTKRGAYTVKAAKYRVLRREYPKPWLRKRLEGER